MNRSSALCSAHFVSKTAISVNSSNSCQNPCYAAIYSGHNWHAHTCSSRAPTVACIGISHYATRHTRHACEHQMLREGSSYHSMILPDYGQLKEKECFLCGQCQIFQACFFFFSSSKKKNFHIRHTSVHDFVGLETHVADVTTKISCG